MCPSRVRLEDSHPAQAGAAAATQGTREREIREAETQKRPSGKTKAQEESQGWKKWERRRGAHRRWGEGSAVGPPRAGGGGRKERRDKEQEKENKGAVGVDSPPSSLPELWGCLGDCLQGSGLKKEGAVRGGEPVRPSSPSQGLCPGWGLVCPWPSVSCHTRLGQAQDRKRGRGCPFHSFPVPHLSAQRKIDARTPASSSLPLPPPEGET